MMHLQTFAPGDAVYVWFNTQTVGQVPVALASGAVRVFKQGSDTEDDSGITLSADYDGVTGLNAVVIDTSADATFYAGGNEFRIVLTAGTANSVSVAATTLASFRLSGGAVAAGTSLPLLHHGAAQSTWQRGF